MVARLFAHSMAEEQDPGKALMNIGFFVTIIPIITEMFVELWPLFIVGPVLFLIGVIIKVSQSNASFSQAVVTGIAPHLPSSKGIDFIEKVANIADNPDTYQMKVKARPAGTHYSMGGVSPNEYAKDIQSFNSSSNRSDFARDPYNEYESHEHKRVLPLEMANPVSTWYDPEDEWGNPEKYW
jgi:hypothetical protein